MTSGGRACKGAVYHGTDYGQPYDLQSDPEEFENLWDDPAAQGIKIETIKQAFDAAILATDPGPPLIGRY